MYHLLLEANSDMAENIEAAGQLGEFINRYGFMIVFSAVVLVILIGVSIMTIARIMRKSEAETSIINEERKASIEQNRDMFNLVTKVQTEQVLQLQQMTESLREMNSNLRDSQKQIDLANTNFELVKTRMLDCDNNHKVIRATLDEILTYAKNSNTLSRELIDKINALEIEIIQLEKEKLKNESSQKS